MREAAAKLARTLQGLTVRLADVSQTPAAQSAAAVAQALPLLLSKGLSSSVGAVQVPAHVAVWLCCCSCCCWVELRDTCRLAPRLWMSHTYHISLYRGCGRFRQVCLCMGRTSSVEALQGLPWRVLSVPPNKVADLYCLVVAW